MGPVTRGANEKNDDILTYLKSEEFANFISSIVKIETQKLLSEIDELKKEIRVLKDSNIEVVRLFDGFIIPSKNITHKFADIPDVSRLKKSVSFADAAKTVGELKQDSKIKTSTKRTPNNVVDVRTTSDSSPSDKPVTTHDGGKWTPVISKKKIRKNIGIVGTDKNTSTIKGVAKLCHLHVYRLDPIMTAEQLSTYLKSKGVDDVKCAQLNSKFPESYSSFKVSASNKFLDALMKPEIWPEDVCVNRFFSHLVKKDNKT